MEPNKKKWSGYYTMVLVANVIYILIFYFLMNAFNS